MKAKIFQTEIEAYVVVTSLITARYELDKGELTRPSYTVRKGQGGYCIHCSHHYWESAPIRTRKADGAIEEA